MGRFGGRGWALVLLLALVWSSLCVGADAGDLWYKRGRRERPGVPLWKPPDATPVVVETPAPTEDTTPAPRMEGIEAIDNVDIEAPGALEKALAARARASDKELIVMAVGDTRDHRRMHKDPALSQISVDFAVNLVENLAALGLRNYLMLTSSAKLCDELRRDAQIDGCVHSSHLIDHPKLELWNVKPGDMFLLWAQQWRVVRRALQSGYSVMRVDSDVVFLEDPYLALHGPLLSPYAMVSQTDVFNLGTRPKCEADAELAPETNHPGVARCGLKRLDPNGEEIKTQLNIGLTYFRRSAMSDDGPVLGVLNDMLSAFETKLGGEVAKDDEGNAITEALLDQPMFRSAVAVRAAASGGWRVASGAGGAVYADGECPHSPATCEAINAQRARADISYVAVNPRTSPKDGTRSELIAGAPDWLFGRGCVKTVLDAKSALSHLRSLTPTGAEKPTTCDSDNPGVVNHAPGGNGVGSGLVAVHMVYSKARKRRDAMEAMGWWRAHVHGRGSAPDTQRRRESAETESKVCEGGDGRGVLFAHTYFRQMDPGARAFVCARGTNVGGCPCCEPVPDEDGKGRDWAGRVAAGVRLASLAPDDTEREMTADKESHIATAPGCGMHQDGGWNEFWD